jgi:hypothetical protein
MFCSLDREKISLDSGGKRRRRRIYMSTLIDLARKAPVLTLILPVLIVSSGCSGKRPLSPARWLSGYYLLEPTVFSDQCGGTGTGSEQSTQGVSNARVVCFAEEVKTTLRERMNNARLARTGGGVIQVLTAAISAMFTGTTGASALGTSTILSGVSAIMPELSGVIGAKERAEAYAEGAQAIEDAQALYLKEIAEVEAKNNTPPTSGDGNTPKLTPAGAKLYETTVAAIHVVEKALTGQIPTLAELQRMRQDANKIEVVPPKVTLRPGDKTTVQVSRGGPLTAFASENDTIASVKLTNVNTAEITAEAEKDMKKSEETTTITFANDRGGSTTIVVTVKKQ